MLSREELELRSKLKGSLLLFTRFFFEKRTGREFTLSKPLACESHFITVCRELTKCFYGDITRLMINLPPGWAKSELCKHFIAWAMAHYPDSNFLYVSHSVELATKHTHGIKQIMELAMYRRLFDVELRDDSSAKDHFTTTAGGVVSGWGAKGGITGYDAGLPALSRFSGALVLDDLHKPDEVHSDTIREHVKRNYIETLERRLRSPKVPVICIGQRLHEDDLPGNLLGTEKSDYVGFDGQRWNRIIIKALDACGNAVYPELNPKEMLANLEKVSPYVYSSQYMQDPLPAGGSIFKPEWFTILPETPELLGTFIACDTAETDKSYNDATVFSWFGVYKVVNKHTETDTLALHWLDCREIRVEPKDLEAEFHDFYRQCSRSDYPPRIVAIEKKSTGVTLSSVLKDLRGIKVVDIERTSASGNKTTRFLGIQPIVAAGLVSFTDGAKHRVNCIEHLRKITANNSHAHDDIADTLADGVQLGLIEKIIVARLGDKPQDNVIARKVMGNFAKSLRMRKLSYGSGKIR